MLIDGQCHCGAIRYRAEIDPRHVTLCHCTDCQALTGTAFRTSVSARRSRIEIDGAPRVYSKTAASGAIRHQHFCGACGSPLFTSGEGADAEIWGIRWGGIRQREALIPGAEIWRRSAAPWVWVLAETTVCQTE